MTTTELNDLCVLRTIADSLERVALSTEATKKTLRAAAYQASQRLQRHFDLRLPEERRSK